MEAHRHADLAKEVIVSVIESSPRVVEEDESLLSVSDGDLTPVTPRAEHEDQESLSSLAGETEKEQR